MIGRLKQFLRTNFTYKTYDFEAISVRYSQIDDYINNY